MPGVTTAQFPTVWLQSLRHLRMISGGEKFCCMHNAYEASKAGHRYIGWLANVTLDKTSRENVSQKSTSSVALDYFKQVLTMSWLLFGTDQHFSSQLKREEVVALYEFYKEDFLMFGYSYLLYLTWHFGKLTQRLATFKPFRKGYDCLFFTFQNGVIGEEQFALYIIRGGDQPAGDWSR